MTDPHRALHRALVRLYPSWTLLSSETTPWASVTFYGMRHVMHYRGPAPDASLGEQELALAGHLVADISARVQDGVIVIEALTIETGEPV
jgi:hypothetical protein